MTPKSTRTSLQVSVVLPQDFSLYVKWQQQQDVPSSELGRVCHALEHFRFLRYRNTVTNSSLPPSSVAFPTDREHCIASECGHACHPAHSGCTQLCPVCEVTAHLCFLHTITLAWDKVGGPRLRRGAYVRDKSYSAICNGWHTARLQFQKSLNLLHELFEYEKAWELKNPFEVEAARNTNCASTAIKLALEESRYPALLAPINLPPKRSSILPKTGKVKIAPTVQIKHNDRLSTSAVKFTPDRPRQMYSRYSQGYKIGSHACPPDSEFEDTSGTMTEPGDIKNLKIYITDDEDAFEDLQKQPHICKDIVGEYQGLLGMHKLKGEIFDFLIGYIQSDPLAKKDFEYLVSEADRMTVLIDGGIGGVLDCYLFDGSNENEDSDDHHSVDQSKGVGHSDWTCLKECLSL